MVNFYKKKKVYIIYKKKFRKNSFQICTEICEFLFYNFIVYSVLYLIKYLNHVLLIFTYSSLAATGD